MSQFYAEIQGNRGPATRMGSKDSGLRAHIRGWDIGVRVCCYYNKEKNCDEVRVTQTGGSNGITTDVLLLVLSEKEGITYVNPLLTEKAA